LVGNPRAALRVGSFLQNAFSLVDQKDAAVLDLCATPPASPTFRSGWGLSAFLGMPKVTENAAVCRRGTEIGLAWPLAHRDNLVRPASRTWRRT
jgi:pyridoxine 4-dehydrogenase